MSVSARDLSEIKNETRRIETLLSDWCLDGEVRYLRRWAYVYAEKKAEFVGMPKSHDQYVPLQILTRSKVISGFYESLQEIIKKIIPPFQKFEFSLVKYSDIDPLIEKEMDLLTKPAKAIESSPYSDEDAYCQERDLTRQIECSLSEFVCSEDLDALRRKSLEYADKRAQAYGFLRKSDKYKYLQAVARHELMSEAEEYLLGFSDGDLQASSKIIQGLLEHNDLDMFFKQFDRKFRKN